MRKPHKNTQNHDQMHKHNLDNKSAIISTATPVRKKQTRHPLRENEHYTLDSIRETLNHLGYYNTQIDPFLAIDWIKGHSGNPLHEKSDRHAARAAFRHTKTPQRYPENDNDLFCLYVYECLVEEDIIHHVQKVCKELWLKNGEKNHPRVDCQNSP